MNNLFLQEQESLLLIFSHLLFKLKLHLLSILDSLLHFVKLIAKKFFMGFNINILQDILRSINYESMCNPEQCKPVSNRIR